MHLRSGRLPDPVRPDEALLLEAFAEAYRLQPGHQVRAVINGKQRELRLVGTALQRRPAWRSSPGRPSRR